MFVLCFLPWPDPAKLGKPDYEKDIENHAMDSCEHHSQNYIHFTNNFYNHYHIVLQIIISKFYFSLNIAIYFTH